MKIVERKLHPAPPDPAPPQQDPAQQEGAERASDVELPSGIEAPSPCAVGAEEPAISLAPPSTDEGVTVLSSSGTDSPLPDELAEAAEEEDLDDEDKLVIAEISLQSPTDRDSGMAKSADNSLDSSGGGADSCDSGAALDLSSKSSRCSAPKSSPQESPPPPPPPPPPVKSPPVAVVKSIHSITDGLAQRQRRLIRTPPHPPAAPLIPLTPVLSPPPPPPPPAPLRLPSWPPHPHSKNHQVEINSID